MAVPEYYEVDGDLTLEQMLELKESGIIGDGAYYTYNFTVDGTEPALLDVVKQEDGDLKLTVKDNRHVAIVSVMTATGGYAGGKIYTTVNEYGQPTVYVVDPMNGYSSVAGFMDDINFAKMMDAAGGPAKTVVINGTEVQVGRPVYVGCDTTMPDYQYIGVIIDPSNRSSNRFATSEFYDGSIMRGIAFVSGEMAADGASYVETFAILFNNGKLYTCTVTYKGNAKKDITVSLSDSFVETGLNASKGASMTLVGENELCIAVNTGSGVELYSYDLTTNTASKLCDVAGAQSLVAPNLMSDIAVQTTAAAKVTTGSLMAAASYTEGSEIPEGEDVTIADGNATITLHKDGTNGKLVVTFDPTMLTYQGMTSASVFYSVNDAEAVDSKLVIAYAAAQAISAEDILATLSFQYSGEYVDTVVNVAFEELIADVKDLDESEYSEKTWNALQDALKAAEEVLGNDKVTQDEIDRALENLDKALKALAPETGKNPETGDRFNGTLAITAMLFSVVGLAVLVIFRKKLFLA